VRVALAVVVTALAASPAARAQAPPPTRVLLTGDSMMEVLQRQLAPELRARGYEVHVDARVGSGLTRPFVVDWLRHAPRQAVRIRPDVTLVFLGAGDIDDFRGVARCCGERWVAAYARRVRRMVRAYGRTFWLTMPAPAHPDLARVHRALNRAVRRASPIIDLAAVFSADGKFHRKLRWGGELRTVRASDGVHLSVWGSLIASAVIGDALERQP
jgi:hypothetical protein